MDNANAEMFRSRATMPDPGDTKSIYVDRSPITVPLVSAAAEVRTLARPTRENAIVAIYCRTYAGDITLTVTGGYNVTGDTTFVFGAAKHWAIFQSRYDGTNLYWSLVSHYGLANNSPAEGNFDGLVASVAEINRNNQISSREVLAGATLTLSAALHDGKTVAMPAVCAITLPAASGSGVRFKLYQKIAATAVTITAAAADLYGVAWVLSDNSAAVLGYEAAGSTVITFDGSTKGGRKGHITELEDVATNLWQVRTMGAATGTEATPFS